MIMAMLILRREQSKSKCPALLSFYLRLKFTSSLISHGGCCQEAKAMIAEARDVAHVARFRASEEYTEEYKR